MSQNPDAGWSLEVYSEHDGAWIRQDLRASEATIKAWTRYWWRHGLELRYTGYRLYDPLDRLAFVADMARARHSSMRWLYAGFVPRAEVPDHIGREAAPVPRMTP